MLEVLNSYKFTPGLIPTVMVIVLLPLFIKLGFWQIDRGDQKLELKNQFVADSKRSAELVDVEVLDKFASEQAFSIKKIRVGGSFGDQVILLDNRIYNGAAGYYVFALYDVEGLKLLVNTGWIKANPDRGIYPEIKFTSEVELTGLLKKAPYSGVAFGNTPVEVLSKDVARVQSINITQLEEFTGDDIYPYVLRLDKEILPKLIVDWPEVKFDSNKHYGYAFQWFSFAVVLIVLYVWLNLHRTEK